MPTITEVTEIIWFEEPIYIPCLVCWKTGATHHGRVYDENKSLSVVCCKKCIPKLPKLLAGPVENIPFPECSEICPSFIIIGAEGCRFVCPFKFEENGDPKKEINHDE